MKVGVRELKNNLSSYLKRVKAGETLEITERGKVVGRIVPPPEGAQTQRERLLELAEQGVIEWSGGTVPDFEPVGKVRPGHSVSDIVIQNRE